MLLIAAALASTIALILLLLVPSIGVLAVFLVRPLVDATWADTVLGSIKLTEIVSAAVPLIVLLQWLISGDPAKSLRAMPLSGLWVAWSLYIFCFSSIILVEQGTLEGLNILFRHWNGIAGFYMVQAYLLDDRRTKWFVMTLLVAGLFPIGTGVYESLSGDHWRVTLGEGGVIRTIGLYHDAITIRYYALQTILALILAVALYWERRRLLQMLAVGYGLAAAFVILKTYSKSGTVTLASWIALWPLLRRRYATFGLVLLGGALSAAYFGPALVDAIGFIFQKEFAAISGEGDVDRTFSGRWFGWLDMIAEWRALGTMQQWFGSGSVAIGAHNDYLQILFHGGIIGLLLYVSLLLAVGLRILGNLRHRADPWAIAALYAFIMWMVDTIGLVPSAYSGYQWFVWGVIGLALRKRRDEDLRLPRTGQVSPR